MFYPGETLIHEFTIPFPCETEDNTPKVTKVVVTYKQDNRIVLVKTITSLSSPEEESSLSSAENDVTYVLVHMTQKETLIFADDNIYTVQLNVYFNNGTRATSNEMRGCNGVQHYKKTIGKQTATDYETAVGVSF